MFFNDFHSFLKHNITPIFLKIYPFNSKHQSFYNCTTVANITVQHQRFQRFQQRLMNVQHTHNPNQLQVQVKKSKDCTVIWYFFSFLFKLDINLTYWSKANLSRGVNLRNKKTNVELKTFSWFKFFNPIWNYHFYLIHLCTFPCCNFILYMST